MGKSAGIKIPNDCNFIYIFENEKDFIDQINSGRIKSLYGTKIDERNFYPFFMAYIPLQR